MFRRIFGSFVLVLFLFSGCESVLDRSEAERSLKVLNSNFVNFLTNVSDKPEFEALHFLIRESASPDFLLSTNNQLNNNSFTNMNIPLSGSFLWCEEQNQFVKNDTASEILLEFPVNKKEGKNARFVITEYKTEDCKNLHYFPTSLDAKMFVDKIEKFTMRHRALVQDNFPLKITNAILSEDYESNFDLRRTRDGNSGTISIEFEIITKGIEIGTVKVATKIEYTRNGYYFTFFDFELNFFEHQIKGQIDYGHINPTANDYLAEFNHYSEIVISEHFNKKIGNIILGMSGDGELLDYFVKFNNGDQILLKNYIPLFEKVLDYKY